MKQIQYVLLFIVFMSCNGQNNDFKNLTAEQMNISKFNVDRLEKFIKNGGNEGYLKKYTLETKEGDTIIEESSFYNSETDKYGYTQRIIPPIPHMFYTIREYDENGNIVRQLDSVFLGYFNFDYGKEYFFNKNGQVVKMNDYSKEFSNYKIKADDLLKILQKTKMEILDYDKEYLASIQTRILFKGEKITPENILKELIIRLNDYEGKLSGGYEPFIINPKNRKDLNRIRISKINNNWLVNKDYGSDGRVEFLFNGNTSILMNSTYILDNNN